MEPTFVAVVDLGRVFDQYRYHARNDQERNAAFDRVVVAVFEFGIKQPFVNAA